MERPSYLQKIELNFSVHPIVAILGPRQCGKTTLARMFAKMQSTENITIFDLESEADLARLQNPTLALQDITGLIVIDEIQMRPELFPTLRTLVDRPGNRQKYLILGSASRDLIRQSLESLAGRIAYMELTPFSLIETHDPKQLWVRGGFPKSYLANNIEQSNLWRKNYINTFLERDIPNLGIKIPAQNLRRFWMMISHYHGNVYNSSEIGRSLNLSHSTIKSYVDILTGTFMVRELKPWFTNIKKRQVKSSKIYLRDSGILHTLLNINSIKELSGHPKLGASWEGFALEEVIRYHQADAEDCYFWSTYKDAELDLLITQGDKKLAFEFKYTSSPKITKSMQIAIDSLQLDKLVVVIPGKEDFKLGDNIRAVGLEKYLNVI